MKQPETTLVLGGCRSGKSSYAQLLAESFKTEKRLYVATCEPLDEEMCKRVERHKNERGSSWSTHEEPIEISDVIACKNEDFGVILIDCLTLWVTNMLLSEKKQDEILKSTAELCRVINRSSCPVVVVSNEVGAGIVPENSLARQFRDVQGLVNQVVAGAVSRVVVTFAGIPLTIKGKAAF